MSDHDIPQTRHLTLTGILTIIFGVLAMATPLVAGTAVVLVIGILLILVGGAEFIQAFRTDPWSAKLLTVILGVVTIICGVGVVMHPLLGLTFLTLLLASFFVVQGLWKIIASFRYRPAPGWIGLLFSGIITLLLGFMIWNQWPLSGVWAVGILVGVDLLVTGISMVALASTVKQVARMVEESSPE